ncbi:hypothetical protein PHK61_20180 [Actinomycetospora lutea]|uniref:hypothetical protein n=1 Tax=Actinomycetospora lutea TaxID=663604 RepID=UPI0023671A19|nr:hypothetical protein [Actinomycetospora lutea]MDD7940746.1 hypothetical protein [Actinomycetospora lutea]
MSTPTVSPPVPRPVRAAVVVWLVAVGAGVAETLVRLALPDPPGPGALVKRAVIAAGLVVLVLALREGRTVVRWLLALLMGVVGTLAAVAEPITWLAAGGSPATSLAGAGVAELGVVGLRVTYLAAVLVALVLVFRPAANAFFRLRATPD